MNPLIKLWDKFFIKQWSIGIMKCDIDNLFNERLDHISLKHYPVIKHNELHADPFIIRNPNGNYHILFEKLCKYKGFGNIYVKTLNENFEIISNKELLSFDNHLSYPSVYTENNKTYVIPESSEDGNVYLYEFDFDKIELTNKTILISNSKLLDTTILKYGNKYWLFSTRHGSDSNNKLIIHYSDYLKGPYYPHQSNPFINSSFGCRPAGSFIAYKNEYFRPTQNCTKYYGGSIVMNRLIELNEYEFKEEYSFEILPGQLGKKYSGLHTINLYNNIIVIDLLKKIFSPILQVKIFINKKLYKRLPHFL